MLWRAVYAPGDSQTSPAYSSQPVQYLYINQLLFINKPVLSYPLLRLLPQAAIYQRINQCCRTSCCACFHSGDPGQVAHFILYTHPHSHTSAAISASRSLFRHCKWFCFEILQCTLHRLKLSLYFFACYFAYKLSVFLKFILFVGSKQRATTTIDFEHVTCCSYFFVVHFHSFQPQHTLLFCLF